MNTADFTSLGGQTKTKVTHEESGAIAISFPAKVALKKGQLVKLTTTGELDAIAEVTDRPFGLVVVGANIGDMTVVSTDFKAILVGEADGDVTVGASLSVSGENTAKTSDKYKTSVATNIISAVALETATSGNSVKVGILKVPVKF